MKELCPSGNNTRACQTRLASTAVFKSMIYALVLFEVPLKMHTRMQLSALRHFEATCIFHVHVEITGNLLVVPLPELYRPWIRGDKNSASEEGAEWCVEERCD